MRSSAGWTDICIKNMSARGLMAEAATPPPRGSYVEIRRGQQIIIGCVIWAEGGRFGVRAQDRINVDAVVTEPRLAIRPAPATGGAQEAGERRGPARRHVENIAARAEQSRRRSAALQFLILVGLGGIAAILLASGVYDVLSTPLREIGSRL
jgi:hypothetical protein